MIISLLVPKPICGFPVTSPLLSPLCPFHLLSVTPVYQHTPAPGPFHLLVCLPGMSPWLPPSLGLYSGVTSSGKLPLALLPSKLSFLTLFSLPERGIPYQHRQAFKVPCLPGALGATAGISQIRPQGCEAGLHQGRDGQGGRIKGVQGPGFIGRTPSGAHRPEFLAGPPGNILMGR